MKHWAVWTCLGLSILLLGFWLGKVSTSNAAPSSRVFELRTYTANEGKMEELQARFRNHTTRLFEKHGMTNIGYWTPQEAPGSQTTLIYILAHSSRAAADKSWEAFRKDPEWIKVKDASEVNGKLVNKADSVYLVPTDFSLIK